MQRLTRALPPQKRPLMPTRLPINDFGAYLRFLRDRKRLTQEALLSVLEQQFEEYNVASLTKDMYRRIEAGRRAPQFEELLPLLAGMGEACGLSREDVQTCLRLARLKLENLQRKKPQARSDGEWRLLEIQLTQLATQTRATTADAALQAVEKPELSPRLSFDTSHLLGREAWVEHMISYPITQHKKFIAILGMMGEGKTSGLKWLLQRLLELDGYYPIFYTFSTTEDRTPTDQLTAFVSAILAELHVSDPDGKTPALEKQIAQVLSRLAELSQRVVFLVDDAHLVLDNHGQLTPEWDRFLRAFVASDHRAALFWAAREWPSWSGRDRSLVVDGSAAQLPALPPEACAEIWRRMGFDDVEDTLLRQASAKYGYNPLMIELRGKSLLRPRVNFAWPEETDPEEEQEPLSEHQRLIRALLREQQTFGALDIDVRHQLKQVVSHRLTQDGLQTLEVLAASPIPLPLPLLMEVTPQADYALAELSNASLIDRTSLANSRAQLQPLAHEAGIQRLHETKHLGAAEEQLVNLYQRWLEKGAFHDEQEQAALVSELAVLYLKRHQLLQAAELLVEHGWLSFIFGHGPRLARLAEMAMRTMNWHTPAESEAGGLLLQHDLLARFLDNDLGNAARKQAYLSLFEVMMAGAAMFQPKTVVHLTHHKLRYLIGAKKHEEAWTVINAVCEKYHSVQTSDPITATELLDQRAYVRGRWGDYQDGLMKQDPEGGQKARLQSVCLLHWQEAADIHQQCAEMLFQHERFASRLQQSRIRFKRARLLHDLAYYRRCAGQLEQAKQAMEACLSLKEAKDAKYTGKNSLAGSYGDYGQLLSQLGQYQDALRYSDLALRMVQQLLDEGDCSVVKQKGMLLVEKGKVLLLLGRLEEAKTLLLEGSDLVAGTARDVYKEHAGEGLRQIEMWNAQNPRHQLDWRWFPRYHNLVLYDDIAWLAQAGPFLSEEQAEWEALIPHRGESTVDSRLSALLVQSRRREIAASLAEPRIHERDQEPHFHYPLIPLQEVQTRRAGFEQLRAEIEQHEPNLVVRRLYLETIDERIAELHLVEATHRGDDQEVGIQHKRLAAPATMQEFQIALNLLFQRIEQGQNHEQTQPHSEALRQMLTRWQLLVFAQHVENDNCTQEAMSGASQFAADSIEAQTWFEPATVQAFFEDIFRAYQFPWSVQISEAATSARVDLDGGRLILPNKSMSGAKIRELLAHEIEVHAFRSVSGAQSQLALLSSGLGDYLATEEGLASLYVQETVQRGAGTEAKPKIWIGTLACGLAAGIVCSPLSFRDLLVFIEQVSLLIDLLDGKALTPQLRDKARKYAENRCLRTYRGVTHLKNRGICSNKDTYYLRGFLAVCRELEREPAVFDRLMVGSAGLHHLADLAELGIISAGITHKHLATDPALEHHIEQFANQRS